MTRSRQRPIGWALARSDSAFVRVIRERVRRDRAAHPSHATVFERDGRVFATVDYDGQDKPPVTFALREGVRL